MLVVDFTAGPGVGKSALALGLTSALKMTDRPIVVEYLPEFAKGLVWRNRGHELKNRFWSADQQFDELSLLCQPSSKIDVVVFDGSLVLDAVYANWTHDLNTVEIDELVKARYQTYPTLTVNVQRNPNIQYEETGRFQTLEQSHEVDIIVKRYLEMWGIKFIPAYSDFSEVLRLRDIVLNRLGDLYGY